METYTLTRAQLDRLIDMTRRMPASDVQHVASVDRRSRARTTRRLVWNRFATTVLAATDSTTDSE